jgi:hypothetical protein
MCSGAVIALWREHVRREDRLRFKKLINRLQSSVMT